SSNSYMDSETSIVEGQAELSFSDSLEMGLENNNPENNNIINNIGNCSIEDSLMYSMSAMGHVDIHYMAIMSGVLEDEILDYHAGKTIVQRPEGYDRHKNDYEDWVLKVEYLRGNLNTLLRIAEIYNDKYQGRFDFNVKLIKDSMPDPPSFYDIHIKLGASWILSEYIGKFIKHLFKMLASPKIQRTDGKWNINYYVRPLEIYDYFKYGTTDMSARKIIEHTLNASSIKIYDEVVDPDSPSGKKRIVNPNKTVAVINKQQLILDEFQKWLQTDEEIMKELTERYNEVYAFAVPRYDGSMLSFGDISPDTRLYAHQRNAAMRIILSPNTLLCHDVGSGKTYCYVVAVHEMKRLGISRRNMIVVPNATFAGTVAIHKKIYPEDKILEISPASFTPEKRQGVIDEIEKGDYVAIYIAASRFDMLSMTRDHKIASIEEQIKEATIASRNTSDVWTRDYYESKSDKLRKKREKLIEDYFPDERGCFDQLGITCLIIDECQNYKNLTLNTKLDNIVGMHTSGSKKADALLEKVRYIQKNNGKIVFATGTLLTNSISDLYVFQYYLQPDTLKGCSISTFDEWINTFGTTTTNFEIDVDTTNFRYVSRISHYHNLPELMAVFSEVCDFYHIGQNTVNSSNSSDLSINEIDLPDFAGFKDVVVKPSPYLKAFNKALAERTEKIRKKEVKMSEDNILCVVSDGRKAAMDMRILDPTLVIRDDESKAGVCAKKVAENYFNYPGTSQIIFCDFSTPKDTFNEYDEIKFNLIILGVKESDIAFIHDGTTETKKNKLIRDLDAGKIRVMIGSTAKLGVGVNVQKHLLALHHLDAPWRPSDLTQREGRLIRQGNLNKEVFEYRYITENSFDAYVWQILENKQHFIGSFLAGSMSEFHRTESEIDAVTLELSEVKALALGNNLIKDRIVTANQLERARISERERQRQLYMLREKLEGLPSIIKKQKERVETVKADIAYYNKNKISMSKEERLSFGQALMQFIQDKKDCNHEAAFKIYMGFGIYLPLCEEGEEPYLVIRRNGGRTYRLDNIKEKNQDNISRAIDGVLNGMSKRLARYEKEFERLNNELAETENEIKHGNPYNEEVEELREKLIFIDKQLEAG
ncbi:MAG: hypothetical protein K6E10_06885, partial [Eubacterium sp.]|nr:hypothetical protein [Eubacterium sp.]